MLTMPIFELFVVFLVVKMFMISMRAFINIFGGNSAELQRMREKYGRKRPSSTALPLSDSIASQPAVKIQRTVDVLEPPEDDISIAAHIQALKRECQKSAPNSAFIADKMARTVSHRMELIQKAPLSSVLETYPCLRFSKEVLAEGERTYRINDSHLRSFLGKNFATLQKAAKGRHFKDLQEAYLAKERTDSTDVSYAALLLPCCLAEESIVLAEDRRPIMYPHVTYARDVNVFDNSIVFRVNADGFEITEYGDVVSALTAAFIMYWIFNVKYPKSFLGTLSLLDAFVFRKCSVRPPQKVLTFINKLQ